MRLNKELFILCKSYIIWITVHYIATITYAYLCTPRNLLGFVTSPILVLSPECRALNWVQIFTRKAIENMWGALSLWAMAKIKDM